jgi:hypothetical protein
MSLLLAYKILLSSSALHYVKSSPSVLFEYPITGSSEQNLKRLH